jgi:Zn-dependent protease with chaperone function
VLPDLSVLLAILLGLSALREGEPELLAGVVGTIAATCVAVALTWMSAERGIAHLARRREESDGDGREPLLAAARAARWVALWPLVGWAAAVAGFDWGLVVGTYVSRSWWIGRYVALFAPALVTFSVSWALEGRLAAAIARAEGRTVRTVSRWEGLRQGLRRNGLAILPLTLLLAVFDGAWLLGEWGVPGVAPAMRWLEAMPLLGTGVTFVLLSALTIVLPLLLRRVLSTRPLPEGPVRELLERQAERLRLRYRDLLLWRTGGRVLNAMVVGFTPRTRTIFLTDGLLRALPDEEVLAVFSHEAGHAKRHHLPLFLVLFVATALLFHVGTDVLTDAGFPYLPLLLLQLAFFWFVLLGTVSRVFEREADVFGADHAAALDPDAPGATLPGVTTTLPAGALRMMRSLERIARLSGRSTSHRHGSIQERVAFVAAHATEPAVRAAFRKRRGRLYGAVALAVVLAGLAAWWRWPSELALARASMALTEGEEAYVEAERTARAGADAAAAWRRADEAFRRALAEGAGRSGARSEHLEVLARWGAADTALRGLGDPAEALKRFDQLLQAVERAKVVPREDLFPFAFQARIDAGRLLARSGDLARARAERAAAAALARTMEKRPEADYRRERVRLLTAVIAARGDPREREAARAMLAEIQRASGDGTLWEELRRDAEEEAHLAFGS